MKPPAIPLSPQQLRRRRKNILYSCSCVGIALVILAYLFIPGGSTEGEDDPAPTEQQTGASESETTEAPDAKALLAEEALSDQGIQGHGASPAEEATMTEADLAQLPAWQAGFARLSAENRRAFAIAFAMAKKAYSTEQWAHCLALLNDCELIYDNSPNVWNLRACALLATGELNEAESFINRSLEFNAEDSVALMCKSELLMMRRDFRNCIPLLEHMRRTHKGEENRALHDTFTFHQLLCHLMLRQEMEARALVSGLTPMTDSPLYYFSQAAFCVYKGDSNAALEPLRSATNIYGNAGVTSSYRKWMNGCGLADKYVHGKRP